MKIIKNNLGLALLLCLFSFLFFFRLDFATLASWDEAWYAAIARNILQTKNWLLLTWDGIPFYDHPPMGFWIMAMTYKILGVNELTTRLPSALAGLATIILVYLTAQELFGKKVVSFTAALIMGTCVWYVIRVRSGNLDSLFVMFYILTIYAAVRSLKDFKRWFLVECIAFAALVLTKTLVGWSAVTVLFLLQWRIVLTKSNMSTVLKGAVLFLLIVAPWYLAQNTTYSDFFQRHFIDIGTRNKTFSSYFNLNTQLPLFYLHMGIRKWYYLWIMGVAGTLLGCVRRTRFSFVLLVWNFIILYPFLTTDKTEIWHLIPVYLPISLVTAFGIYEIVDWSIGLVRKFAKSKFLKKFISVRPYGEMLYIVCFVVVAVLQLKVMLPEVISSGKFTPDDVDIARRVAKYNTRTYLDDDFLPVAIYYSEKNVIAIKYSWIEPKSLVGLFNSKQENYVVITRNWALDNLRKDQIPFKLLESNNTYSIISK